VILALLSDIHANLEALEACLRHARDRGAGRFAFLGDFVGYGADPAPVVAILMRYASEGAIVVKGNHDEAVGRGGGYANEAVRESIAWARAQLSPAQKVFLAGLELVARDGNRYFVHASASSPERWTYVDSPGAAIKSLSASPSAYTFCGHVHEQALFAEVERRASRYRPLSGSPVSIRSHRRWLAIVGSVGQPRDGVPAAAYATFDDAVEEITFYRVPYDHHAAAAKIRRAGLPAALAYRVEKGA